MLLLDDAKATVIESSPLNLQISKVLKAYIPPVKGSNAIMAAISRCCLKIEGIRLITVIGARAMHSLRWLQASSAFRRLAIYENP